MKALTLTQPWATLVAIGAKRIETRSWRTDYRGLLAIHAAKGLGPVSGLDGLCNLIGTEPFLSALGDLIRAGDLAKDSPYAKPDWIVTDRIPRGAIIAVCEMVGCYPIWPYGIGPLDDGNFGPIPNDPEHRFGDYTPGRYAWFLSNIRALPEPIPARGALGLWEYEGDL